MRFQIAGKRLIVSAFGIIAVAAVLYLLALPTLRARQFASELHSGEYALLTQHGYGDVDHPIQRAEVRILPLDFGDLWRGRRRISCEVSFVDRTPMKFGYEWSESRNGSIGASGLQLEKDESPFN